MSNWLLITTLLLFVWRCWSEMQSDFNLIGQFKTKNPSFVELIDLSYPPSNNPLDLDLVVTNFAETGTNGITSFNNIGRYLYNITHNVAPPQTILADKTLTWPNFVYVSDPDIFPAHTTLIVHDGFLTPLHGNGGVYALLLNDSLPTNLIRLIKKTNDCYYHNSTMIDMNGDGLKDILLAQTCKSVGGENNGKLIWLEQPQTDPSKSESWVIHSLIDGPDILTTVQYVNSTTIIVFASQFFTARLVYYYLRIGVNTPYVINNNGILIDDSIGAVYDAQIVDIFKNGKKQLLVNDHIADGAKNGVWLYEFPDNFPYNFANNNSFNKHQIADNFNTTGGVGVGAPGFVYPFDLNANKDKNIPFKIGIAGDGNYFAWELSLTDEENFIYTKDIIKGIGGTCGSMAFADIDGDGFTEVFVPWYEGGIIYVYTSNPDPRYLK